MMTGSLEHKSTLCCVKIVSVQTFNRTRNPVLLPTYLFSWTVAISRL